MLGLGTSLVKGGMAGRQYIKDGLKLYMPYRGDNTTKGVQFVGTGSTSFGGHTSYIDCGTALGTALGDSYDGGLTVSMWIKPNVIDGDDGFFNISSLSNSSGAIYFRVKSDSIDMRTNNSHSVGHAFTDTGAWHHVTGVFDGAKNKNYLYLDGVLVDSDDQADDLDMDGLKTVIGTYYSATYGFVGSMKNVAIWSRVLTPTEIQNVMYKTYAEVSGRLASGLVSWWALDVDYTDYHGDNDGTNVGSTLDTDLYGGDTPVKPRAIDNAPTVQADAIGAGSALFDADTEYISLGATSNFFTAAQTRTVSCWVKLNDASASNDYFFYFGNTSSTRTGFGMGIKAGDVDLNFHDATDDTATNTTRASMLNTWTHICATYDGSTTVKIYVNGVLDTTIATGGALATDQSATAIIGGRNTGDPLTLAQEIDANVCQFGVWSAVLTQEQIQSIMEKTYEEFTASEKTNLVSYWALDVDGSDSHGDNDGTLT